jgi:purine-binding chemotaxis protein CheW
MMQTLERRRFDGARRQFLSFWLAGLEYGLDFNKVRELRSLDSLERVAAGGGIVGGVVISRGVIMPIVDLRVTRETPLAAPAARTDVIILQLSSCVMGMVVDSVTDVVSLRADQIGPLPGVDGAPPVDYLIGIGARDGRRLVLVDIDRLMAVRRCEDLGARQAA